MGFGLRKNKMALEIFGFQINFKKKEEQINSVVTPVSEDGSVVLSSSAAAYYSTVVDMDTSIKNENDLIRRYREISLHPECDSAIEEIANEAVSQDFEGNVVKLNLEELKVGEGIKKKIQAEFEEIKFLIDFDNKAHDLFRSWYIDGRQYHIISLNPEKAKDGILKVEMVDSRKIRKVKKVEKQKDKTTGVDVIKSVEEYFIYNEKGIDAGSTQGIKLSVDSVIYIPSGLFDQNSNLMFSYLHKAVKPVNQLKMLEDAVVIYRIARAPERRIFYIDVGNLPKVKAEQYVTDIMNKYKNKIVYDASTGEVRDDRKYMSMLEDFWMPRREGGKGTEITTLPGGQTLGQMEDVNYFQQKLYQSLNVPITRLLPQQNFSLGRSNEITRDELKFNKFVKRLRNRFGQLLVDLLRVQLIAKNIVSADDWKELEKTINIDFVNDNNFVELRDAELWQGRFQMLNTVDPYVGKYFSPDWVKREILKLTEEQIKEMDKEMESMDDKYLPAGQQQQMMQQEQPQEPTPDNPAPPPINNEDALNRDKEFAELQLLETVTEFLKK
jgi:hypothetical protein